MNPLTTNQIVFLAALRISVGVACGASLWAALAARCRACKAASQLAGGMPLGWIGAALYALTLASTFVLGVTPVAWVLAASTGAHLALVAILLRFRVVCPACLITPDAALAATASVIALAPLQAWPALGAVPLTAALTWRVIVRAQMAAARKSAEQCERLLADAARNTGPVPHGQARLVILSRPDCEPCQFLQTAILPSLVAEFKETLQLSHQPASEGVPTPTLLVLGQISTPLLGLPPTEAIGMAIRLALGQSPSATFDAVA